MMVKGIDVGLVKSSQALALLQDRTKLSFAKITYARSTECHCILEFLVVKHRNFRSAPPAPEQLHKTEREFSSLVSQVYQRPD
jgi:hypothetical protein